MGFFGGDGIPSSEKGMPNGVATLDSGGFLSPEQIPFITITDTQVATSEAAMLDLIAQKGDVCIRTDINKTFILADSPASTLANWKEILTPADGVQSVNGLTGSSVSLALDDISNVTAPTPALNDVLRWNGTAWVSSAPTAGGDPAGEAPPVTTGLEARWDASAQSSVTVDANGFVSQWNDLSGNGHTLSQGTATSRPSYRQHYVGSTPLVTFGTMAGQSTTAQSLNMANPGTMPFDTAMTVFFVIRGRGHSSSAQADVLSWGSSIASNHRRYITDTGASVVFRPNAVVASQHTAGFMGSQALALFVDKVTTTTTVAQTWTNVWKNAQITGLTAFTNNTPTAGTMGFYGNVHGFFSVAEILVYKADLTDAQVDQITAHLAAKWNI